MNADIPYLHCWIHSDLIAENPEQPKEEAYAFAIQSVRGRAIGFHCMLKSGAHYRNVPLHALALNRNVTKRSPWSLACWDCFSNRPVVTVFDYLREHECTALLPTGAQEKGVYMFTIDWLPDDAEHPGFILQPDQNKCGHVLALESGNVCMLPTNKILWRDAYFIGNFPNAALMGYKTQDMVFQAERATSDFIKSSAYFY